MDIANPTYLELYDLERYPDLENITNGQEKVNTLKDYYYYLKEKKNRFKSENNIHAIMVVDYYKNKAFDELSMCSKNFYKKSMKKN
ncbi:putative ORfan [Saudi moumouvirus]|uniref:Uncharacterized protein n=1 Tax=Moumouvirus sp. 'Monve' TaxID=1128131 RepID=H2ED11_9VIRU|nr:hypothetical protein mv_L79 [Moumouvirus Monve]AQN68694.1 putative ORfan [Saudi moumouvirus]